MIYDLSIPSDRYATDLYFIPCYKPIYLNYVYKVKEGLQSVLRIGSAHNKGGPPIINIVQISHFPNSF